jgi:hypothetical protein
MLMMLRWGFVSLPRGPGVEVLHPVSCGYCGTEVGVRDQDEIYHFYSALASS